MNKNDALEIIKDESLEYYSFFEDRADGSDEVVIKYTSGEWTVYATNERASKITDGERIFDNEEAALENFIKRLRALNKYINKRA